MLAIIRVLENLKYLLISELPDQINNHHTLTQIVEKNTFFSKCSQNENIFENIGKKYFSHDFQCTAWGR